MMISDAAITATADILVASDFFRDSHGLMFQTMVDMWGEGTPVDAVTLVAELEQEGKLKLVGGKARVYEIARLVPASANVRHYASIVRDASFRRGLIAAAGQIAECGWDSEGDNSEKLQAAETLLDELRKHRDGREQDELVTLHDAAIHLEEKFRNPPDESAWMPGPWSFVPRLGPGRLYVLGGYPADGKTSTGLQFGQKAANAGFSVTALTLEMSKWDLAERLASTMGLPAKEVATGQIHESRLPLVRSVLGEMVKIAPNFRIWDNPSADVSSIRAHVKTVRPNLLIVDHLHQFHLRAEYERQDLEEVVRGLWRTAREFDMTVLLLAQLSRSGDKKHPFPAPTLSALKGSGAIEQLAWAVWFVYRLRDQDNLPGDDSQFICAKNRSGTTGIRRLMFHPHTVMFTEVIREAA